MAVARDPIADALEEAQRRLTAWGLACRSQSDRLGLPRISSISVMIDHVRREDRLRRGVRKSRMKGEGLTAKGKQKRTFRQPSLEINSLVMEVDHVVARMPGWMQATVIRRYLYGQPDRLACKDLRLPKTDYRQRCNAAIEYVAERLRK